MANSSSSSSSGGKQPSHSASAIVGRAGAPVSGSHDAMLHFIYTDSLPHIDAGEVMPMAQHLLVVADRYNLAKLKSKYEDTLRGHFDTSTVATILVLAEQHGCGALKDACFEFVAPLGKFKALTASDGFEHLMRSCPHLLKELVANLAT